MVVAGGWRLVVSQTLATFPNTWWESWNEQDGNTYFILLYLSTFQITSRTFTMHSISPPATMKVSLDTPINKRWCSGDLWQRGWRLFVGHCCFPLFSCIFFSVPWYLRHGQYHALIIPKIARVWNSFVELLNTAYMALSGNQIPQSIPIFYHHFPSKKRHFVLAKNLFLQTHPNITCISQSIPVFPS